MTKQKHPDTLGYNKEIGKRVRALSGAGIKVADIFADIQSYQCAPGSYTTFYKYYRADLEGPRIEKSMLIGDKVANQAINGDDESPNTWKAREFWLRTQANWTPKESVETREAGTDAEEKEAAIDALTKALGLGDEDE